MSNVAKLITFTPRTVSAPGRIDALAVQYLKHIANRGRQANTVIAYRRDLEAFVGYMLAQDVGMVQVINTRMLEAYVDALLIGEGKTRRTVARMFSTVRSFFRFCIKQGVITFDPCGDVDSISFDCTPVVAPAKDTILRFLNSIPCDTATNLRDRALFRLMYDACLRIDAPASLDVFDPVRPPIFTVWPNGRVVYRNKGGAPADFTVENKTLEWIDDYLAVRHALQKRNSPPALFLSTRGQRMERHTIHAALKKHAAACGVPHLHSHLLRHRRVREIHDKLGIGAAQFATKHKNRATTAAMYGFDSHETLRRQISEHCPVEDEAC